MTTEIYNPEKTMKSKEWKTISRPGYQGKNRDAKAEEWNVLYGKENWRIAWELRDGQILDFEKLFWQIYVASYVQYFLRNPEEANFITSGFSYAYDKELVSKKDAFDPYALYEKAGKPNQFHNVALNIALEWFLERRFTGKDPIQVRQGKPGTPSSDWPTGWRWSPGLIPTVRKDLIPENEITGWWQKWTMEDFYQKAKVLQVK